MVDRPAELLALCRKTGERELEAPVALGREAEKRHPAVASRLLACDEPALLGAAHELRDGALRELHAARELGHGGLPTPVGRALDLSRRADAKDHPYRRALRFRCQRCPRLCAGTAALGVTPDRKTSGLP